MLVRVRNEIYRSVPEAARRLKVSEKTIYSALARGTEDTIGLGRRGPHNPSGGVPKVPLAVAGVPFESITALAKAIGRPVQHVRKSLKGGPIARQRIVWAVMKLATDRENAAMRERLE